MVEKWSTELLAGRYSCWDGTVSVPSAGDGGEGFAAAVDVRVWNTKVNLT